MSALAAVLGEWISTLRPECVPAPLRGKMQDHLLDTIGAGVAGNGRDPVRIAAQVFRSAGGIPLLIDDEPRALADAVRVNAVAAHAAEIDDTEGCDHTGAVVVPPVLALLAREGGRRSGDALLTSMVAGYEIGRRVQLALGGYDNHNRSGWHSTATCGVFAAAAAAGHFLDLDATQCTSALAIAASASAGTWAFAADGSMTKHLHVGNAAVSGLRAAMLARAGATGPETIFENVWGGFFRLYGNAHARPELLVAGLGERWHATHSAIKMYAACRSAHPALDGIVDALDTGAFVPDDVTRVTIETSPFLRAMICPRAPRTVEAARMSLPISIALLLLGSSLEPDAYCSFETTPVQRLLRLVEVRETECLRDPAAVRVTVRAGSAVHVIERMTARGSEHEPFTRAEVHAKFRRLTVPRIGPERAETMLGYIDGLGPASTGRLPQLWDSRAALRRRAAAP